MRGFDPIAGTREFPYGVVGRRLELHGDPRGSLTEVFRAAWTPGLRPLQWSAIRSLANTLRGVHVHPRHDDLVAVVAGRMLVGLRDLRDASPTSGRALCFESTADAPALWTIPHGVAHGFFFPEPVVLLVGATEYFDGTDEVRCRYDDPDLGIPWPAMRPVLSECDANAAPFAEMVRVYRERSRD